MLGDCDMRGEKMLGGSLQRLIVLGRDSDLNIAASSTFFFQHQFSVDELVNLLWEAAHHIHSHTHTQQQLMIVAYPNTKVALFTETHGHIYLNRKLKLQLQFVNPVNF